MSSRSYCATCNEWDWHPHICKGPSLGKPTQTPSLNAASDGLDQFLAGVKDSCRKHAQRKGYLTGEVNKLGRTTQALGIEVPHAIGEIVGKLIEFQVAPRKVIAEKIAGWAWRLWLNCNE